MVFVEESNGYSLSVVWQITSFLEEDQGEEQEFQPSGDGEILPSTDPDFEEVSVFLLGEGTPDPEESASPVSSITPPPTVSASPAASSSPGESAAPSESEVYSSDITERLDNLIVQVGVIDIVVVLTLLISVLKNFIRVPR